MEHSISITRISLSLLPSLPISLHPSHRNTVLVLPTFPVGVQQRSSCLVSLAPVERDQIWFRSKGKFCSLIKEWRAASSAPQSPLSQTGRGLGRFMGIPTDSGAGVGLGRGGGRGSPRGRRAVLLPPQIQGACAASLHTARRHHLELRWSVRRFCARPGELRCRCSRFASGAGCDAPSCSTL